MFKRMFHIFVPGSIVALLLLMGTGFTSPANAGQGKENQGKNQKTQTGRETSMNTDAQYVAKELAIDSTEMVFTKDALSHIKEQRVKDYANMLIDDHQKDAKKLTDIREDQNIAQIVYKTSANEKADSQMKRLRSEGAKSNFDIAFLQMQVKDHKQAIDRMKKAESQVSNDKLKSHLKDDVSTMQKHLDKAQSLLKDLKSSQTGK